MSQTTQKQTGGTFGRVAVLMGGDSAEREVSLKSGQAALKSLQRSGIDAFGLDLRFRDIERTGNVCQQIAAQAFDTAFIALHGRGGEDGVIQGVLEALDIPYTGCRVAASAIAMDKLRTKLLWSGGGLPTPAYELVNAEDMMEPGKISFFAEAIEQALGFPVMIKPVHEGSSIGMNKATERQSLIEALQTAARYDREILVEKWIVGQEYTGAVLNGQTLPLIRLETPRAFYDYQAKYFMDDTLYHCPCGLDEEQEQRLRLMVLEAFDRIGAHGWGRVDFMCDEQGEPWLIEINTVPGLTDHSLVPMAAKRNGMDFDELILQILNTAVSDD